MAVYKVIQDIEAEDKLLGPLTLRQFIYAAIAAVCFYICFLSVTKHAALLMVIFLPIALAGTFFAWPWKLNQPTEVWALAKIRFILKPRQRIWDQSGIKELVTITAPKREAINYTDGLSQVEVKSRLKALADTIDTRGWAIKNLNVNLYSQPTSSSQGINSDRLIDLGSFSQEMPNTDIQASDDILDTQSNPIAQHFDQMINASQASRRSQIIERLKQSTGIGQQQVVVNNSVSQAKPNDYWFLNEPQPAKNASPGDLTFRSQVIAPGSTNDNTVKDDTPDEDLLDQELKAQRAQPNLAYSHLHTLKPAPAKSPVVNALPNNTPIPSVKPPPTQMTQAPDPDIIALANNNDLDVATLARQAHKQDTDIPPNEVVISLH